MFDELNEINNISGFFQNSYFWKLVSNDNFLKLTDYIFSIFFFQILFTEFVDWALEKNLDIEDDVDAEIPDEEKDE